MFREFKEFAVKGNAIDLAIGVIIGAAFGKIVDSLVKDVIMPPFGLLAGKVDFTNLFINIGGNKYLTLAQAQAAGAPTINYGLFLNALVNFVIIAFVIFLLIRQINRFRTKPEATPNTKPCEFCLTRVPLAATRCMACTSVLK